MRLLIRALVASAIATLVLTACSQRPPESETTPEPPSESAGHTPQTQASPAASEGGAEGAGEGDTGAGDAGAGDPGDGSEGAPTGGRPAPPGVQTPGEEQAGLDHELEESLRGYDESLTREQETLADRRDETLERVAASAPPPPSGSAGMPAPGDESDAPPEVGGQGPPSGPSKQAAPPPGTPDGSDDDIVARQLREAAENEDDPELRAKLWEEYRKYKTGDNGSKKTKKANDG